MIFLRRAIPVLLIAMAGALASAQSVEFVQREILVKFRGTAIAATSAANLANRAINAKTLSVIPKILVNRVQVPAGMSVNDALFYYGRLSSVEYAEPNSKKRKHYIPNDPRWNNQYGQTRVKCPEGWNVTKGSSSVVIAIIDDGIDLTHEDLVGKIVPGYDYSDGDNDPSTTEDHGTHTAGIAAANTDNGKGVAGTGFNCKVMPLKIFPNATDAVSAAAIIHAADNGAKVISMSYGSYFESTTERNAVNYAWSKGLVLLSSSGNDGIVNKSYPAALTNVIAVGSTGTTDLRSGFSNYGADWVDVGAPGEDVESTIHGGYAEFTGTSMSCPMAAGVAGLLWSFALPGTTATQIRNALEQNTDPISNGGFKFGRVNAFKALQSLDPGSANLSTPTNVQLWTGASESGLVSDVTASDSQFFTVTTSQSNLGQLGGVVVDLAFVGSTSNLRESLAYIETTTSVSGTTGQLYIWDYTNNKYVLIKAFATQPVGTVKRQKIALPLDLTKYVSGGNIRLGIRSIGPNRSPRAWNKGPFEFNIGFVQVSTRENQT